MGAVVDMMHYDSEEHVRKASMRAVSTMASGRESGPHNVLLQDQTILAQSVSSSKGSKEAREAAEAMTANVNELRTLIAEGSRRQFSLQLPSRLQVPSFSFRVRSKSPSRS